MSLSRIYQPLPFSVQSSIYLDERASHYVARVLRSQPGNKLLLFNGQQAGDYEAVITHIGKKKCPGRHPALFTTQSRIAD